MSKLKNAVRAIQEATGLKYTAALQKLRAEQGGEGDVYTAAERVIAAFAASNSEHDNGHDDSPSRL